MAQTIFVYVDWEGLPQPLKLGLLHVRRGRRDEIFEFQFDPAALDYCERKKLWLDPRLGLFEGHQHPAQGNNTFGVFADASPDRWGRFLMGRRLARDKRAGLVPAARRLQESDYLLGVHDIFRSGALRFCADAGGPFLDNRHGNAAPPWVHLRELAAASLELEKDTAGSSNTNDDWLNMLIAPGGSLGGARPKASVVDVDGSLWIAKFPSVNDTVDTEGWELILHTLAYQCGLHVPEAKVSKFASPYHSLLVKRFDRTANGRRLHFASAMTLTGRKDGDDHLVGASYVELARVLIEKGANTKRDLRELWSRIVFNMLVSNTDDHMRNHGFILIPGKGWRLSPAYDMNPVPHSFELKLNVSETDNVMDLDLARSSAQYFRVGQKEADAIITRCQAVVRQWPTLAKALGIPKTQQQKMASAFQLARQ